MATKRIFKEVNKPTKTWRVPTTTSDKLPYA